MSNYNVKVRVILTYIIQMCYRNISVTLRSALININILKTILICHAVFKNKLIYLILVLVMFFITYITVYMDNRMDMIWLFPNNFLSFHWVNKGKLQ